MPLPRTPKANLVREDSGGARGEKSQNKMQIALLSFPSNLHLGPESMSVFIISIKWDVSQLRRSFKPLSSKQRVFLEQQWRGHFWEWEWIPMAIGRYAVSLVYEVPPKALGGIAWYIFMESGVILLTADSRLEIQF